MVALTCCHAGAFMLIRFKNINLHYPNFLCDMYLGDSLIFEIVRESECLRKGSRDWNGPKIGLHIFRCAHAPLWFN